MAPEYEISFTGPVEKLLKQSARRHGRPLSRELAVALASIVTAEMELLNLRRRGVRAKLSITDTEDRVLRDIHLP